MIRVFIGYDPRQEIALSVASASFLWSSVTEPIAITPVDIQSLPFKRQGLTPFTFTRFLVPWMCGFEGFALFADADVTCIQDPHLLFEIGRADPSKAVWAVDTDPQFERAAVMLFNCGHPDNQGLTPGYCETANGLHQLRWTNNVGWLDHKWNHLVGYDAPSDDPAIIHYTAGVPCHPETSDCEHAEIWNLVHKRLNSTNAWSDIMGNSAHNARDAEGKIVPKYKLNGGGHAAPAA